eukprot:1381559-Prymnesium_polylepis.1
MALASGLDGLGDDDVAGASPRDGGVPAEQQAAARGEGDAGGDSRGDLESGLGVVTRRASERGAGRAAAAASETGTARSLGQADAADTNLRGLPAQRQQPRKPPPLLLPPA